MNNSSLLRQEKTTELFLDRSLYTVIDQKERGIRRGMGKKNLVDQSNLKKSGK